MISLQNVTLHYGDHTVIQGLTYTFPEKGIVALMGASGLGKTTLLRLLCGLEDPTEGSVQSTFASTAVAFQEPRLIPWLTCEKNITFVLPKEKQGSNNAQELLADLELLPWKDAFPETLSGGMKQRVSLARALVVGADLLLLDEPLSALDEALKARVCDVIKRANPNGLTVIITHDEDEARALGATVLRLSGEPVNALCPT